MTRWLGLGMLLWMGSLSGCAVETNDGFEEPPEDVAEASAELSRPALSKPQEATVLKLIDDICGDTWCEGDNNFRFDRLDCRKGCAGHAGSCQLTFRVFSYDTDVETGPTYTRTCRTDDFSGFGSLVATNGQYQSLVPEYYDALTQCISRVEEQLPR
jgi:hypothetical protein